jgi:hypothetical protein
MDPRWISELPFEAMDKLYSSKVLYIVIRVSIQETIMIVKEY